ncbi:MAG TPA: dTDP-4-dehydrorhamnose 3,5-epimerase [Flavobacteriales bacterium]|nr:dTDP-4-dehydrorhamnose 3,5-epimerase [Flavobacteriales bacterium]
MHVETTKINDLLIIHPDVYEDDRGYFFESYNRRSFADINLEIDFVQDNESLSQINVLRGLHFQDPPHTQAKLIRVIQGSILDVAVDIRRNSSTYGKNFTIELSAKNRKMFFLPKGFAHGFLTLEDDTIFAYKCSTYYQKQSERTILWNDPVLNIEWGIDNPILSNKDQEGQLFHSFKSSF